jgi:phosphoglycerate dehydrogenase-like enzyme
MKVVLDYLPGPRVRSILASMAAGRVEIVFVSETDKVRLDREIEDCDVLLHVLRPVSSAVIESSQRLSLIQKIGVGVDTIDMDSAIARSIAVCNMPGTNTQAVVELTLSLMLAAIRKLKQLDRATCSGRGWDRASDAFDSVGELSGATVGLLGYGNIPQRLAPVLRALGANVVAYSLDKPGDETKLLKLDEVLATSDLLSLHLPLTKETSGLLNAARLGRMKDGAIIVNTARGGLIDEMALISALKSGRLAGAALDVFAEEPIDPANELLALPNVLVTPHVAWLTIEMWRRSISVALENCARLQRGEALLHRIA